MKYVIMNVDSLNGFQMNRFQSLFGLFYQGSEIDEDGHHIHWADALGDARLFDSEEEAWELANIIWHKTFVSKCFAVLAVQDPLVEEAVDSAPHINEINRRLIKNAQEIRRPSDVK